MIRWEEQQSGEWTGYSGQIVVATAKPAAAGSERWDWEVTGAGKLKGARNAGHRTTELDARRAADAYWQRWLEATALRPDLERLAAASLSAQPRRGRKTPTALGAAPARRAAPQDGRATLTRASNQK